MALLDPAVITIFVMLILLCFALSRILEYLWDIIRSTFYYAMHFLLPSFIAVSVAILFPVAREAALLLLPSSGGSINWNLRIGCDASIAVAVVTIVWLCGRKLCCNLFRHVEATRT